MRYREISRGLHVLLDDSRRVADTALAKLHAMQEVYLDENSNIYDPGELPQVRYYLKAVSYKFHLANLSLEQLWSLSHSQREEVVSALENSLDRLEVDDDDLLLISFVFEGFLLQARTFLDFYMLYLCLILRTGHQGSMSRKRFFRSLERAQPESFADKAAWVHQYFDTRVFGSSEWEGLNPNNWGTLLTSLRDKIAHRDRLRPSFDSEETLIGEVLFSWPTLQRTTYDRFCQYMQNGMFALFTDVSPVIYGLEWKPGPYRSEMWDQASSAT